MPLRRIWVECLFLSGQIERARSECEQLFELAPDPVSRVSAFCLKAAIQEQQSQLAEAVETIRQGLAELDVSLPSEPAEIEQQIGAGIGKMLAHLERVPIEDLVKLPALTDPLRIATTELLFQIIPAASQINPPLFILAELVLFDLALCHGTVPGSAKNIMDCGIVFSAILEGLRARVPHGAGRLQAARAQLANAARVLGELRLRLLHFALGRALPGGPGCAGSRLCARCRAGGRAARLVLRGAPRQEPAVCRQGARPMCHR